MLELISYKFLEPSAFLTTIFGLYKYDYVIDYILSTPKIFLPQAIIGGIVTILSSITIMSCGQLHFDKLWNKNINEKLSQLNSIDQFL